MTPQDIQERLMFLVDNDSEVEVEIELQNIIKDAKAEGVSCHIKFLRSDLKTIRTNLKKASAENNKSQVDQAIDKLNEEFFISASSSKVRIGRLSRKFLNGHAFLEHQEYTKEDFRLLKSNELIAGQSVADWWLESPGRRLIHDTFMSDKHPPNAIVDGRLNLWQGFSVEPKPGDWQWFTKHVHKLMRKDPVATGYVLKWLALAVQRPTMPIGTMLTLIGDPGAGKGAIGNIVRSIFGAHGVTISDGNQIVGRFNGMLRDACFVFADEAFFAGSKANADRLKHLITEPTIGIERKYRDAEEVNNRLKIFAVTNHEHAVSVEPGDRRHAVFECAKPFEVGDKAYWKAYWAKADDPVCKAAVLDMLRDLDIEDFSPERDRPQTDALRLQKLASFTSDLLWWRLVLESERWAHGRQTTVPQELAPDPKVKHVLHKQYTDWHAMNGVGGNPTNAVHFWRNFRKWASEELVPSGRGSDDGRTVRLCSFDKLLSAFEQWLDGKSGKDG